MTLSAVKLALLGQTARARQADAELLASEPIAIVGAGCRLPGGVRSLDDLARLLAEGRDAITTVPEGRWDIDAWFDADPAAPGKMYTRWGGFIDDVDRFDAAFFGIAPREAALMDPQQRIALEVAWEALEDAGQRPDRLAGSAAGVFIGVSSADHAVRLLAAGAARSGHFLTGGMGSLVANRISYLLDLRGPSLVIDTACSSSLVAVHQAVESLRRGETGLAIAGGVNVILAPELTAAACTTGLLARDGRCKAFDAAGDGYVRSEGCALVVLKRLADALADHDRVHAVIRGTAVNHDGRSNGLTAPSARAQAEVMRAALANGRVAAADVGLVEAHGTGTALGDPLEVEALTEVYGAPRPGEVCFLGSVKTNLGHLEAAAGIAGLLKAVVCLRAGAAVAHLHLRELNPGVRLAGTRFAIPRHETAWAAPGGRFAAVSSFGIGGTNAHVVLEEAGRAAPSATQRAEEGSPHVLCFSAKRPAALAELAARHARRLAAFPDLPLGDLCHSALQRRAHHEHRAALVATSPAELVVGLTALAEGRAGAATLGHVRGASRPRIAFLFTGSGAQYRDMGRGLYRSQPRFRETLDRCATLLRGRLLRPLLAVIFPETSDDAGLLDEIAYTQPATFALEVALAELWRSWGVVPDVVLGHSLGEYAAATVAGALSLEDALTLVAERARLHQALPRDGAMAAIFLAADEVAGLGADGVEIAARQSPEETVVAGPRAAVRALVERCRARGVEARDLLLSHAAHCALVEPMLDDLERAAHGVRFMTPAIPFVSTVTGGLVAGELGDPAYWRRHCREAVDLVAGMHTLDALGTELFVEVGPAPLLLAAGQRCLGEERHGWVASLRKGHDDARQMAEGLATLYTRGAAIDAPPRDLGARPAVDLPTYPFQRDRHWIDLDESVPTAPRRAPDDVVYELTWRAAAASRETRGQAGAWLILGGEPQTAAALGARGAAVVVDNDAFAGVGRAAALGVPFRGVAVLAGDDGPASCGVVADVVRALLHHGVAPRLWIITRGTQAVTPGDTIAPSQAAVWGFGRVLALEHPELWGGLVDLDPRAPADEAQRLAAELLGDHAERDGEDQLALRGARRLVLRLLPSRGLSATRATLSADACYLVTGGLGTLGEGIARTLARLGARHLALVGRTAPSDAARGWLRALEDEGIRVTLFQGDVGVRDDMARVLTHIAAHLPPLRGVIHAAGVRADGIVLKHDAADFAAVWAPKALGAWHLHELTAGTPLDFFVLYSSVVAAIGSPGQGAYAAANAYVDALAAHRRALGLPGLSLGWCIWGGGARAGDAHERAFRLLATRLAVLDPALGREILARALGSAAAQLVVWNVEPAAGAARPAAEPAWMQARLAAALPAERPELLAALLCDTVGDILGLGGDRPLRRGDRFFDVGMDSLMAIELKNRLQRGLGTTLPVSWIFNHPSADALARKLAAPDGTDATAAPGPAAPAAELSDAEVTREIARLTAVALGPGKERS